MGICDGIIIDVSEKIGLRDPCPSISGMGETLVLFKDIDHLNLGMTLNKTLDQFRGVVFRTIIHDNHFVTLSDRGIDGIRLRGTER